MARGQSCEGSGRRKRVNRKTWDIALSRLGSGEINVEAAAGLCGMTRVTFLKYYNQFLYPEDFGELAEDFFIEEVTESVYVMPKSKKAEDLPILE